MTDNAALAAKRQEIEQIDAGILALIQERMRLATEIAAIKKQTGKDIEDLAREESLFQKITELNQDPNVPNDKLLEIWGKIVELSKKVQSDN